MNKTIMQALNSLVGSVLLVALTVSGLLMIVAPAWGRELLKNTGAGVGIVLLGLLLLEMFCGMLRG